MGVTTQFDMVGGTTRYGLFDDFLGAVINPLFGGVSTNSGTAAIVVAQEDGVVGLITGATNGNYSLLTTGLNYKANSGGMVMEAGVAPITNLTGQDIFVGFTDTVGGESPFTLSGVTLTSNATDAVGLLWSSAGTAPSNWYAVSVKGDADGSVTPITTNALVAGTFQAIRVEVNTNGDAYFFINGTQVGMDNLASARGQTGRLNAITTTVAMTPIAANATNTGSAARTAHVDYMYVQKGRKN